jgi:drug/metabolite transporter (DMT)-like permease
MKTYLVLLVGVVSVSFASIFIRLAEAPPLVIAAYRLTIASLVLIPIASRKSMESLKRLSGRDALLILLASLFIALHFGLWITSLSYTSIASSVILVTSHPAFVAVLSYFLWSERLNKLTIGGIVVALVGIVLINYGGFAFGSRAIFGDLLALVAAFAMGAYLIIGKQLRARIEILPYLTIIYSGAAVILLLTTVGFGYSFTGYSPMTYLMMVLLAIVPQLIGHSCLNLAVRLIPVTFVSVAILGEPIGATILGYFILGEAPTLNEIAGGLLILVGIFTVLRQTPRYLGMR